MSQEAAVDKFLTTMDEKMKKQLRLKDGAGKLIFTRMDTSGREFAWFYVLFRPDQIFVILPSHFLLWSFSVYSFRFTDIYKA